LTRQEENSPVHMPQEFHLKHLQLQETSLDKTSLLRALIDVFRFCTRHHTVLQRLVIDSCMPLLELEVLCWEVSRSGLVRSLVLMGTLLTQETTSVVLETLSHNPRLRHFTLSHAPLDKEAAHYLMDLLSASSTLDSLRLMDVHIQDDHDTHDAHDDGVSTTAWKIANALKENTSLQELEFYQCHVSDVDLAAMVEALHNSTMKQLTLHTDMGQTTLNVVDQLLSSTTCHIRNVTLINENHLQEQPKSKWKEVLLKDVRQRVGHSVQRILTGVQQNGAVVSRTVVHQIHRCRMDNTVE